jgi:hypothetical protein
MFIFIIDQKLWAHELMSRIIGCHHFLGRNDIIKFVYYFVMLFLTLYNFELFLLLVQCSHQESVIMLSI